MGSKVGAAKATAKRLGMTLEDYQSRITAGLKWCFRCQAFDPIDWFGSDRSRSDGLTRSCKRSKNADACKRYIPTPRPPAGRRFVAARDGDRLQARARVNHLVNIGVLPDPNDVPCTDCDHVHFAGERRHEYDHYLGYDAQHHEDVQSVCTQCHHDRERGRIETAASPCRETAAA